MILKTKPTLKIYPAKRLSRLAREKNKPKIELGAEVLKELLLFNVDIKLDKTSKEKTRKLFFWSNYKIITFLQQ